MSPRDRSSRKPFRFKQFSVSDDRCSMKVGTDAVLLGSWADTSEDRNFLDVGTGSGIIALMLAQRTPTDARVEGVEIAQYDCEQAKENVAGSPWPNKVTIHHCAIQEFVGNHKFDHIVSNPPYFVNSLLPPTGHRRRARHNDTLTFEDLCAAVDQLLLSTGKLSVILPVSEGADFQLTCGEHGWFLSRKMIVYSKANKPAERWLMEFRNERNDNPGQTSLTLLKEDGGRSTDYQLLTGEFYP